MMKTKQMVVVLLGLAAVVLLAGCATSAAAEAVPAEAVPVVAASDEGVTAEAVIEPARWSELRFGAGGEVAEVLASDGESVSAGDPLVRLDTRELALSLQSAEQDVVAAGAALEQLLNGASETLVARAARENARQMAQAEIALQVKQWQLEKAQAEDPDAAVSAAQARVEQLRLQLAQMTAQNPAPDVAAAEVEFTRAQIALDEARDENNKAQDRTWEPQEVREAYAKMLRQAELNYQLAQAQLERAQDAQEAHAIGLQVVQAQIVEAEEQVAQAVQARDTYALTLNMLAADVDAAELELEALQAWENPYLDKATAEEVRQAEARLRQAELAVARLELQLAETELRAPFAGVAVDVRVKAGDRIGAGEPVVVLATLDRLQARTVDLTELDVARVAVGQAVTVSVDALPEHTFSGVVREIGLRAKDYRGDVVYDVVVELTDLELSALLRWGMTAMVKIQAD